METVRNRIPSVDSILATQIDPRAAKTPSSGECSALDTVKESTADFEAPGASRLGSCSSPSSGHRAPQLNLCIHAVETSSDRRPPAL